MGSDRRTSCPDGLLGPGLDEASRPVTQAELEKFRRLKEASVRCQVLRDELVERLQAGATVEPGALTAWLQTSSQRRLSFGSIERVCGTAEAERLKLLVEPVEQKSLYVRQA